MLRRIGALLVLTLALAATPASADPYTNSFDTLRTAVLARLAELSGTLTPQQAKEKDALGRITAALSAPSAGLAGDVTMARKLAKLVKDRALRESALPSLLIDSLSGLSGELSAMLQALRDRLAEIPDSALRSKAEAALDRIGSKLDAIGSSTNPAKFAKSLLLGTTDTGKAEKKVVKAEAASGLTPCIPGVDVLTSTLGGGLTWEARRIAGQLTVSSPGPVNPRGRVLYVILTGYGGDNPLRDKVEIGIGTSFDGPRAYTVNGGDIDIRFTGSDGGMYVAVHGTITITEADPDTRRIKGSFDVDAGPYPNPVIGDRHYSGAFEATCVKVTRL